MGMRSIGVSAAKTQIPKCLTIPFTMEGGRNAIDSRDFISNLMLDVQGYYQRQKFSQIERFGEHDLCFEKMLVELTNSFDKVRAMVRQANESDKCFNLRCYLTIEMAPGNLCDRKAR